VTGSRLGRALVHSTAGTAVTRGLGALAGIAIARLLGPSARGDVAILVVLASIASLVGAAGLQFWIIRDVAGREAVTRNRRISTTTSRPTKTTAAFT
jgi:O-antigen/teichoic acid export membrane protein